MADNISTDAFFLSSADIVGRCFLQPAMAVRNILCLISNGIFSLSTCREVRRLGSSFGCRAKGYVELVSPDRRTRIRRLRR